MIYQQTPDFYNEYISHSAVWEGRSRYRNGEDELEHGWVKDAAAKAHKYIRRWRNKAGKWVYQYKNKKKEPEYHTTYANWNEQRDWRAEGLYGDKYHRIAARGAYLTRYRDIQNARKNAAIKGTNLTSRGYSGSKGSGESQRQRNLGTRYSTRSLFNSTKDVVKIGNATYTLDRAGRAKEYNEWRKNPQRTMAKDAILNKRILGKSDKYSANKGYKRGKKKKK